MKRCPKCKVLKPASEFSKNQSRCKPCDAAYHHAYRQTEKGKATCKAAKKRYRQSEKGRAARRAQDQRYSQPDAGRAANRRHEANRREKRPEQRQATNTVAHAVTAGKLPRVSTVRCAHCGCSAQEYHHHQRYSKGRRLDVIPLCDQCHYKVHTQLDNK